LASIGVVFAQGMRPELFRTPSGEFTGGV